MARKASSSGQVISLPKGGGAIWGLGEKFYPDLHTGTGNFSVPLTLPPGRNGFQPTLSLTYSTGSGNGPFGLGWTLGIPGVSRKTSRGIPRYTPDDIFLLSGAEDLVPVEVLPACTRYRPRTEGLFARILHCQSGRDDFWEVRTRDGLTSLYGTPGSAGHDPAVVRNPADSTRVFAWRLTETRDAFGNLILYDYQRDAGSDGPRLWDQLYLKRIRFADYLAGDETRFLVSVAFEYEERPDPWSEHRAGFEIRTRLRCARIVVSTHSDADRRVRTYHLEYLDQSLPAERLPRNGVSLLSRIRVEGHDGERSEWLPPLELGYTRFEPERRSFFPITGPDLPPASLARPDFELLDLHGAGLPDVLEMAGGVVRSWRNMGNGTFERPREMREAPAGLRLSDPGVQLADADGDGRVDLLVTTEALTGYYPLRFRRMWDRRSFQRSAAAPSFDLEDPEVRLVDLDGDGVTDAIRSGSRLECFFNDPHDGWKETRRVERPSGDGFPASFSDSRVKWADMTGDGLQDVVLVHNGSVAYWPNLGRGDWGPRVVLRRSPRFPEGHDPRRILLGDVDGDGLADLVYVEDSKVTLWVNQGGERFGEPLVIRGTPPVTDMDAVRLVDLLGSGIAGLLWTADAGTKPAGHLFFLDFTGGVKPYLLHEIDDHMGAATRVEYAPSTRFFLTDEKRPETRWKTPLPFPVQVVARVTAEDSFSGGRLVTEYRYHHGYWDGMEREFRGFGRVDQLDAESFADFARDTAQPRSLFSPPTLTRTWFHQGPIEGEDGGWTESDFRDEYWDGDPPLFIRPPPVMELLRRLDPKARRDALRALRGQILRTELYALDGTAREDRPYTVTERLTGLREESPAGPDEARQRLFFPHLLAERTTQWERGDDPLTQIQLTAEHDAYGQPRRQVKIAVPRGRDVRVAALPGEPFLATATETMYAQRDDERYIVDRVARQTTWEIPNDGSASLADWMAAATSPIPSSWPVVAQTIRTFDGPPFVGLPFGRLGDHGAPVRTETLVLTPEILTAAYGRGNPVPPPSAGYVQHEAGWFAVTESRCYDFQEGSDLPARGLTRALRDPLGHTTRIEHDAFQLLPTRVIDPAGLATTAAYDYRVLQPREVTDPNGNRTAFGFTPLGLLERTVVQGKTDKAEGDTWDHPGLFFRYDLLADAERSQPVSVHTIKRVHHANDSTVPLPERDETIETREFSDGFGRLLQTRTQAEDVTFGDPIFGEGVLGSEPSLPVIGSSRAPGAPPRVVVSGWQVYNNKGWVVEKYEPFFASGWDFARPGAAEEGAKVVTHYDPRGHPLRTLHPDGSEERILYGVPGTIAAPNPASPDAFEPTPWETWTYDANDNADRTHPDRARPWARHWDTPKSSVIDALGRTIATTERNGPDPATDGYTTRFTYDIRGNLLTATDPLGRRAFRYVYDLTPKRDEEDKGARVLRIEQLDAGVREVIFDAAGNEIERRDSKGALVRRAYDRLNRPTQVWARDGTDQPLTQRERLLYGDDPDTGLTQDAAAQTNLLGKLHEHHDEAGLLTFSAYDFKGNILEKARRVLSDEALLGTGRQLEETSYETSITYDALNRLRSVRYPRDAEGRRRELRPLYNRAGALEAVELDGKTYVERLAYNAKGQRTLLLYGNGWMTRYAHDSETFRLSWLRTERFTALSVDPPEYRPAGDRLQDFRYEYDLAGNILAICDRTPGCGVIDTLAGPDALDRTFKYDPLNRLIKATGREHKEIPRPRPWADWFVSGGPPTPDQGNAPHLCSLYTEDYAYDPAGNMLSLRHANNQNAWTRHFGMGGFTPDDWDCEWKRHLNAGAVWEEAPGNRLTHVGDDDPATPQTHFFDSSGNLARETTSRHFEWDHADRLRAFRVQPDGGEPSVSARYVYDSQGERVKKLVQKEGGGIEVTVYIDQVFEHHRLIHMGATRENDVLHIMDNQSRIALLRVGTPFPDDGGPAVQYQFGDHLGSSNVVVDEVGRWMNREELTPYGETSFGSFARKRYRFTGKERDSESGLSYHSARYYAPWIGRWTTKDPAGFEGGRNEYTYCQDNPSRLIDQCGAASQESDLTPQVGELIPHWQDRLYRETGERLTENDYFTALRGAGLRAPDSEPGTSMAEARPNSEPYSRHLLQRRLQLETLTYATQSLLAAGIAAGAQRYGLSVVRIHALAQFTAGLDPTGAGGSSSFLLSGRLRVRRDIALLQDMTTRAGTTIKGTPVLAKRLLATGYHGSLNRPNVQGIAVERLVVNWVRDAPRLRSTLALTGQARDVRGRFASFPDLLLHTETGIIPIDITTQLQIPRKTGRRYFGETYFLTH